MDDRTSSNPANQRSRSDVHYLLNHDDDDNHHDDGDYVLFPQHPPRPPHSRFLPPPSQLAALPPSFPSSSPPLSSPASVTSRSGTGPSPSRRTRSSARQEAGLGGSSSGAASASNQAPSASAATKPRSRRPSSTKSSSSSAKKRKSPPTQSSPPDQPPAATRRSKRQKVSTEEPTENQDNQQPASSSQKRKGKTVVNMSSPENSAPATMHESRPSTSGSSSRKSSRNKKSSEVPQDSTTGGSNPARRSKRTTSIPPASPPDQQDTAMSGTEERPEPPPPPPAHDLDDSSDGPEDEDEDDEDDDDEGPPRHFDDDDPFGGFGGPPGALGLSSTLRALTGMMSGVSSRLRDILARIRQKEDPSIQLIALQELSEILLVSNEDNLSGHFNPDAFVKELVNLMQPSEFTGEETMLVACRCLANMMEALPGSTGSVVYNGAVPVLCSKLLEISVIDLAEQALSTLEKISVEYPSSIVREGGLTACLSYLDFFATHVQRTAVTTAANCCRNIPEESFPVVRDVMPVLLNVLASSDQRVVEQASLCVTRIIESFKYQSAKLEELVSPELLRAILRLLVPGTTNLISASIHTQFLRVLAITARASPRLSAELFKLNVVETLYQILTGVSPPTETEDVASKLDSVVIMQALIHRPREQIIETLNVICELLPGSKGTEPQFSAPLSGSSVDRVAAVISARTTFDATRKRSSSEKRLELLEGCKDQVRRFALILFPTLTDAFSSTVNLSVRQKVLTAQLRMLSNFDIDILTDALKSVPYASFLAAIFSQRDNLSLVMSAIQITELLLNRLDSVYRYQIYREGVMTEIGKLANESNEPETKVTVPSTQDADQSMASGDGTEEDRVSIHNDSDDDDEGTGPGGDEDHVGEHDDDEHENEHQDDGDGDADDDDEDEMSASPASSEGSTMSIDGPPKIYIADIPSMKSRVIDAAKKFLETHETEKQGRIMKEKALAILDDIRAVLSEIEEFFLRRTAPDLSPRNGVAIFEKLASYFDADLLESVTSAELLASGLVGVLEQVFANPDEILANTARVAFLEVFMGRSVKSKPKTATADSPATPFSIMVHKLQDLLSRSEHFEVITVHQNTFEGNRSSAASMLAKQIRLRLVADDDSDIPATYRNIMVSIHAIATFKSLDEYLRPRITLHERPRIRARDSMTRALALMAGGRLPQSSHERFDRLAERFSTSHGSSPVPSPPAPAQNPTSSRSTRRSKSKQPDTPPAPGQTSGSGRDKGTLRRSTRRHPATPGDSSAPPPPPPPPAGDEDSLQHALECADEKQLSDDDDENEVEAELADRIADRREMDAYMGRLDEDMDDPLDTTPGGSRDPTAVNLEVAAGGSITARKENGSRVPTPASSQSNLPGQGTAGSLLSAAATQTPPGPSGSSSTRVQSYAAAIQSVPQDWHIEFNLEGRVIPNETTIYRAVHSSGQQNDEGIGRGVWQATHSIKYRRVPGPPPAEPAGFGATADASSEAGGVPVSLANHPTTMSILKLLNILHDLNANIDDIIVENKDTLRLNAEPLTQFVNTKLTAKLNRQLEEPLVVASNCLPGWSEDLARLYPFLFPFETRHLFLQSTSFGYARSMSRWQNTQDDTNHRDRRDDRPFLGRLQRQKVRISRSKILESALKVMELYGASQSILEVEYFEEVGTGLGPTLEFYSTVSKEFSKKKLKIWREVDSGTKDEFVNSPNGLFPRPLSDDDSAATNIILHLFKMLGKFVARSMIDSRIIDINLNPIFFRIGDETSGVKPSLGAVRLVDPGLANSLQLIKKFALATKGIEEDPNRTAAQKVLDMENVVVDNISLEDLALDFTLPGYPDIELVPGGSHISVTIYNVQSYLENVIDMTLGSGVKRQVEAFRTGFSQVFPYSALSAFTPDELVSLFGRVDEDWSLETLMDSIKADHGFNMDSRSVRNLLQTMSELTLSQRRDFLQFTTGSPKLPIGGFKSLTPTFTVVCKPSEPPYTADDYLPSVMTCVNYLKLPDYTSIESMKRQLFVAIKEGQGAFHLS